MDYESEDFYIVNIQWHINLDSLHIKGITSHANELYMNHSHFHLMVRDSFNIVKEGSTIL